MMEYENLDIPKQPFNKLLEFVAKGVSWVFHPIFLISYFLLFLIKLNPYLFPTQDPKDLGVIIIYVVILSVLFPIIPLFMMQFLGLSKSVQLNERKERTIPLILTGIFYLWLYINMLNNSAIPLIFSSFLLGSTITLFSCFFINLFTKISLHAAGIAGFSTAILIALHRFSIDYLNIPYLEGKSLLIHIHFVIIFVIILIGCVGTSRLILRAHSPEDIYGGFLVGIVAQIIAMRILLF